MQKLRVLELRKLLKYQCYQLPANTLGSLSPVCMPIIVFYVYIRQGNNITYIQTFTTLMVFEKVLSALKELPQTLNSIVEALESLKRIRAFLTSSDLQQYVETRPSPEGDENERDIIVIKGAHLGWKDARNADEISHSSSTEEEEEAFTLTDSDSQVDRGVRTLSDLQLRVRKGELIAVVGEVGSGKSSLLSAILGEMVLHDTEGGLIDQIWQGPLPRSQRTG